jgi:hypothetical protein
MPVSSKVLIRALLLIVVLATPAITLAQSPTTSTESGAISGIREDGLSIYKGVPLCGPAGRRLALAASGTRCTLDWNAQDGCVCPGVYANWCVHAG